MFCRPSPTCCDSEPVPLSQVLSRAFRNRFVELHFDELPSNELEIILHQRCSLPPSYCSKLVKVMQDLQVSSSHGSGAALWVDGFVLLRYGDHIK